MQTWTLELGKAIKQRRKAIRLTQDGLAMLAGISRVLINEIENGKGNPRLDTLVSVLHVLGWQITIEPGQNRITIGTGDAID